MITIGIDPGLSGAVCFRNKNGVTQFVDTPTLLINSGSLKTPKMRRVYDMNAMARVLEPYARQTDAPCAVHCYIEKAQAMPDQGSVSGFGYGVGYGLWLGIINAFKIPYTQVHPQVWKRAIMGSMGRGKDAAIVRAKELYPTADITLKKHEARAEALLIAHWGLTTYTQKG